MLVCACYARSNYDNVEDLKREVEIQKNLCGHPGIVELDSSCFTQHYSWILLTWVPGGHLQYWSRMNHPIDKQLTYAKNSEANHDSDSDDETINADSPRSKSGPGDEEVLQTDSPADKSRSSDTSVDFDVNSHAAGFLAAIFPALLHCWIKQTHHGVIAVCEYIASSFFSTPLTDLLCFSQDIKPNYIMLVGGDLFRPVLADFGESKFVPGTDALKTARGTPPYRCPKMDGQHKYDGFKVSFGLKCVVLLSSCTNSLVLNQFPG